ncbi:hypothetical protein O181_080408 [Austropuccinia psidii MF-1]|uniref:Uncharacterized protein n=1 Tax=Austropuccinia psidii MF-1 TaxID=1389203 RepID=A0A9Q3FIL3_9BASI|nr:hypothetical protein [Austropuccinia psidii MF-1]
MWLGGPMLEGPFLLVLGQFIPVQRSPFPASTANGEEVEVVPSSIGHQCSTLPSQPSFRRFQIQVIPISPRNFQPVLSTIPSSIPPPSQNPSTSRPALVSPVRPSPIPQTRNSLMVTSQQLQPVANSRRRREGQLPLLFPDTQSFHQRELWPIQVTREDPNISNNGHNALAQLFIRLYRDSREVITYANDRMIPGTASEEMAAKFECIATKVKNKWNLPIHDMGGNAAAL